MNQKSKRLLVVNTGDHLKKFIFKRLKELPIEIVVLNTEKNWADTYVSDWILCDTNNHLLALKAVEEYSNKHELDGVITFWEDDVLLTSKISEMLGVIGIPYDIAKIALDTYNILGCHDYGRVEIKLDSAGNPHVLELNPNPSINIRDCLPSVAKLTSMSYEDFIEEILLLAIKRYKDKLPYHHLQPVA